MQSNNPVFRRSEEFNRSGANAYGNQGYSCRPQPSGAPDVPGAPTQAPVTTGPMTIDSVVQKTAITLGVVILAAAATWVMTPDISSLHGRGGPRPAHRRPDDRQPRRLRPVDGQLVQARDQPAAGAGLRRARGRGPRCAEQVLRQHVRGPQRRRLDRRPSRARHLRRLRRHARGVQVLQHPGRPEVPHLRDRRDVRHGRAEPARGRARACSAPSSASSASAAWACCSRSSVWCSASSC